MEEDLQVRIWSGYFFVWWVAEEKNESFACQANQNMDEDLLQRMNDHINSVTLKQTSKQNEH